MEHVRRVAYAMQQGALSADELVSAGNEALVQASRRWNPRLNDGPFWMYAYARVRGAMVDEVRKWTHYDRYRDSAPERSLSFEELPEPVSAKALSYEPDWASRIDIIDALRLYCDARKLGVFLKWAISGYSMREIAEVEGVTESRVCQLCGVAASKLRLMMES